MSYTPPRLDDGYGRRHDHVDHAMRAGCGLFVGAVICVCALLEFGARAPLPLLGGALLGGGVLAILAWLLGDYFWLALCLAYNWFL